MENLNTQKDTPVLEAGTKRRFRLGKYILVLILGILVAKGLFIFLDRSSRSPGQKDKIKSKIKATQPVKAVGLKTKAPPSVAKVPNQTAPFPKQIGLPELRLSGIASSGSAGWAIINGKIVKAGDKIKGAKVMLIYGDRVELEFKGKAFTLSVK